MHYTFNLLSTRYLIRFHQTIISSDILNEKYIAKLFIGLCACIEIQPIVPIVRFG